MGGINLKAWISAARLRTLPLSISGIIVGSVYSYLIMNIDPSDTTVSLKPEDTARYFKWIIPLMGLITTLGFQILSNLANDYGDGVKGTDNDRRQGPMRALQSGVITARQMKTAIIITAFLTLISTVILIATSLGWDQIPMSLFFLALGVAAIWAAIKYTVGDNAYGYRGLGDLFVFIFFGPVSVLGISYLITHELHPMLLLPAITVGLLSVAVLNLNNMRDAENDASVGKNTLVVKLGLRKARAVHFILLTTAFLSTAIFIIYLNNLVFQSFRYSLLLPLLAFVVIAVHVRKLTVTLQPKDLDPELKKVALATFFFSLLAALSVYIVLV
ncbi:MAG: 1,4-dihydroxy-2-naphthoate octaprenyltransferase [Nonlabens sp.]